jgi:hypothetical protein
MPEKSGIDAALCAAGLTAADDGVCPRAGAQAAVANVTVKRKARRCKFIISSLAWLQLQLRGKATPVMCAFVRTPTLPLKMTEPSARPAGSLE